MANLWKWKRFGGMGGFLEGKEIITRTAHLEVQLAADCKHGVTDFLG